MSPPSRRRILITTDTVGGVWTYASTLARTLARRRCDVVLVMTNAKVSEVGYTAVGGLRLPLGQECLFPVERCVKAP